MRISENGQITIPKHLRERFGLHCDVEVVIQPTEKGLLIQKKPEAQLPPEGKSRFAGKGEHPVDRVAGILDGTDFDVEEYIKEVRGR